MEAKQNKKGAKAAYTDQQESRYQAYLSAEKQKEQDKIQDLQQKKDANVEMSKQEISELNALLKKQTQDEAALQKRTKDDEIMQELESLENLSEEQKKELGKMQKKRKAEDMKLNNAKHMKIKELDALFESGNLNEVESVPQVLSNKIVQEKQEQQQTQTQKQPQQVKAGEEEESKEKILQLKKEAKALASKKQQGKGILKDNTQNQENQEFQGASLLPNHLTIPQIKSTTQQMEIQNQKRVGFQQDQRKEEIHYAIMQLGLQFSNDKFIGSNKRCIEYLTAICKVIQDIDEEDLSALLLLEANSRSSQRLPVVNQSKEELFPQKISSCLDQVQEQMTHFRSISEGMKSSNIFCKHLVALLQNGFREQKITTSIQGQKDWFCDQIGNFIDLKIRKADSQIQKFGLELVKDGDVVMIYAKSMVVEDILIKCHQSGVNFTVIIVDNYPFYEGKKLLENLSKAGLDCMYTLLTHAAYFIKKVTKVFVGASAMLSNGSLVSRVGTALLACISKDYRKPFHVFCESYKFSEKNYLDSLSWNELADSVLKENLNASVANSCSSSNNNNIKGKQQTKEVTLKSINLRYDVTPCEHISMLITEYGKVPPHSVPHIIREFSKYDQVGRVDLPVN